MLLRFGVARTGSGHPKAGPLWLLSANRECVHPQGFWRSCIAHAGGSDDEGAAVADDEEGGQGEEPQADDESVQSPAQAGLEAGVEPWG